MPTYEYVCRACEGRVEAVQKFSDPPLTTCEECGGSLRKVFSPVGIVFKGSGFYVTDYKYKENGRNGKSATSTTNGSSAGSESKSETKSAESGSKTETKATASKTD
jgi:putative FmdB family regulatory protein